VPALRPASAAAAPAEPAAEQQPAGAPSLPEAVSAGSLPLRIEASQAPGAAQRAATTPLNDQLAKPLFTLRTASTGEHVMTVQVTPDNVGPVTVRAHVGADGIRIELIAPNEQGREALRGILADLKRDLSAGGMATSLDISPDNQPGTGRDPGAERRERPADRLPFQGQIPAETAERPHARAGTTPSSRLDVVV
jgi:flagellar hook-length control protein FliK